jgi:chemotaxis protein methyltransferase CheR
LNKTYEIDTGTRLDQKILDRIRNFVYEKSGIKLDNGKESLIRARIGKRMRALGITSHEDYLKQVIEDDNEEEVIHLLDAISTNVTSFFRGIDHFHFLKSLIKEWTASGQIRFRIWSSACSSGEEPYSIAMTVLSASDSSSDIKILATDISTRVLEKALSGTYESEKIEQIPNELRDRYLEKANSSNSYRIKPILRNVILFRRLNLSDTPFPMQGPMDVIFCRNVMIYFDQNTRRKLLSEIHRLLKPHGYLFVGHAESLIGLANGFRIVKPSVYIKET